MDASSGRPSPRRQLQGPRPPRLNVSKESHKIKKPPMPPQAQAQAHDLPRRPPPAQAPHHQQAPPPRIIYDASPKVIHTRPSEFMALVQRLTGPGAAQPQAQAQFEEHFLPPQFQPQELLLSPTAALSPAARMAAIERSVRPAPPGPAQYVDLADDDGGGEACLGPARTGILSPLPSALPPAVASGLFSPLPFDPSSFSWLNELSPILAAAAASAGNGGRGFEPFLASPGRSLVATPTMPSPATFKEFFSNFPDL